MLWSLPNISRSSKLSRWSKNKKLEVYTNSISILVVSLSFGDTCLQSCDLSLWIIEVGWNGRVKIGASMSVCVTGLVGIRASETRTRLARCPTRSHLRQVFRTIPPTGVRWWWRRLATHAAGDEFHINRQESYVGLASVWREEQWWRRSE